METKINNTIKPVLGTRSKNTMNGKKGIIENEHKPLEADGYEYDQISVQVWQDNYKAPSESTREEVWKRVAESCSKAETLELRESVEKKFLQILYNDKFIPAGRILANLGVSSRQGTTLYNCFVHTVSDIKLKNCDSIDGIYDMLRRQAKTLKSEGGYGINASWIRPDGSYIEGIGSRTPGSLKFMELWDKSSEIITQGSTKILGPLRKDEKNKIRKGAQMFVLNIWHPDIEEFIVAKQTPNRLTKFNMSVGITNGFMEAMIADKTWNLKFPDTEYEAYSNEWFGDIEDWESKGYPVIIHKTVQARSLWDAIMGSTYKRNEPGVMFLDIANKLNPVHWFDYIQASNPCFGPDTLIAVADGRNAVTIKQLSDEGKDVPVYSTDPSTGKISIKMGRNPRITGKEQVLIRITLDDGTYFDVTPEHKCLLRTGKTVLAKELTYGDSLSRFVKVKKPMTRSQSPYWHIPKNSFDVMDSKNYQSEHRLIAKYFNPKEWKKIYKKHESNGWLKGGLIVHHKNYDGLDNLPSNLQIMSFKEHQRYHAGHDCRGEKNGRWYGKTTKEIYKFAIVLSKNLGRKFSKVEWISFARKEQLPTTFSKMHHRLLGKTPSDLAKRCATELGFDYPDVSDTRVLKTYQKMCAAANTVKIDNNKVYIEKVCEGCSSIFYKTYKRREVSFCSYECYKNNGQSKHYEARNISTKESQARVWSELFFFRKEKPSKRAWAEECKKQNISFRLAASGQLFQSYKEVSQAGLGYNHRVVSVKELPLTHCVYNITVDDNHTLGVITNNLKEHESSGICLDGVFLYNCGEVPMSLGACNLASINLPMFVKNINGELEFDYDDFVAAVRIGIRFLDNINDISNTPLPEYAQSIKEKRRIGLGVMGLGSLHIMFGIRYGSKQSLEMTKKIFKLKAENELLSSAHLGAEKGSFEKFDKEKYFSSYWWKNLDIDSGIKLEIEDLGTMRNSHQSMNAPTGNTGIYARNVSGGIEPVFSTGFTRWSIVPEARRRQLASSGFAFPNVHQGEWFETKQMESAQKGDEEILKGKFDGLEYEVDKNRGLVVGTYIEDYGIKFAKQFYKNEYIKMEKDGLFATTENLSVSEHLDLLKCVAHFVNMSISKTINLPNKYEYEEFKTIYLDAWKGNVKGITTYREGTMTAVLETKASRKTNKKEIFEEHDAPRRPEELACDIYHMQVRGEKWNFFVGLLDGRPYEIFAGRSDRIHLPKSRKKGFIRKNGTYNLYTGEGDNVLIIKDLATIFENITESSFTRTISLALRHGVPPQYMVEQLEKGATKENEMFSLAKGLQRVIKNYIKNGTKTTQKKCPECQSNKLTYQEGCITCAACGHSKCG